MDGADAAYSVLFREEFARVARVAYMIVHDPVVAEDVTQEAFVQLLVSWSKVSSYDRPELWVRRVAIRRAVRFAQRERVRKLLTRWVQPPADRPNSIDPDLARAIHALAPKQRAAIVLHYLEDRPLPEVATILGCTHATAKVHVFKARRRLAILLGSSWLQDGDHA